MDFFRRGTAILCKPLEHGIDLILPAIPAGHNGAFDITEENVSFILVQVKKSAELSGPIGNVFGKMTPWESTCKLELPRSHYIAFVMDLGLVSSK
jgi:hypothetical protein